MGDRIGQYGGDSQSTPDSAGVQTLVLTRIISYRDLEPVRREAKSAVDGGVAVAEDGPSAAL